MADLLVRQMLNRAIARGLLTQAAAIEVAPRLERGEPLSDVLGGLGIARESVDALADLSLVGRRLGQCEIESLLGCGGMATVYKARQRGLDRTVAVKVFDTRLAMSPTDVERFRREAKAACKLDHPCVVQPIDFGEEGPILYLAMEFCAGGSAESRLEREGPLRERTVLESIAAVASALDYAAHRGLVHRDIKPANILYTASGIPKLADLGIALDVTSARLTQGEAIGTVHYMAPEQGLSQPVDIRADIYSLAITAWDMLVGEPPFNAPNQILIISQHMREALPDVRRRRPDVSSGTAMLLERMAAKNPADRPLPAEVESEAREILGGRPSAAERAAASGTARIGGSSSSSGSYAAPPGWSSSSGSGSHPPPGAVTPVTPMPAPWQTPAPSPPTPYPAPAFSSAAGPASASATAPVPAPAPARRPALLAALALAALVAAGVALRLSGVLGGGAPPAPRAPSIDPIAEARGIAALRDLVLERTASDGGFGEQAGEPCDPWVTAQALEALVLLGEPSLEPVIRASVARTRALALDGAATGDPPGFAGFPYVIAGDNVACMEATAAVGRAFVLCSGRSAVDLGSTPRDIYEFLLRTQVDDGSWATIPILGRKGSMTSATADATSALAAIAVYLGEEKAAWPRVRLAAEWLAGTYDRSAGFFNVNPRRLSGPSRQNQGLDCDAVLALFDARDLAQRVGEPEGPRAAETLRAYAAALVPFDLPADKITSCAVEDYRFQRLLPEKYRTSATEFAWLPWAWRIVVAHRMAEEADMPRRDEWRAEALRLRAEVPTLADRLRDETATWRPAEALFGVATVRAGSGRGGLPDLVRPGPK